MIKLLKFKINDASYLIKLEIVFIHMIFCKYSLEYYSGVNLPDSQAEFNMRQQREDDHREEALHFILKKYRI